MTAQNCIIVGASHAAAQLVTSLRQQGWEGKITVMGNEYFLPYHRPPLSKAYLSGEKRIDDILIRPPAVYEKAGIRFALGVRVESVDPANHTVTLDDGESISYEKLVLTTGSHVRKLPVPGADLPGVFYLRSISDVEQIRGFVGQGKKAVIIGGGYIGLETAAVLKKLDMDVTILEAMDRVLQRVTTPEISEFYARVHTEEGINIVTNAMASSIEGEKSVQRVVCKDGQSFDADVVIIGIGITPATELAEGAGLEVDNGIVVNEFAQTSDPDIFAAGDCTFHYNPIYDRHIRLESVQNAVDQASVAAAMICGKPKAYNALPWFWSDQFDMKLQIAGLSEGHDKVVVRGDISSGRSFAAFYLKEGRVLAVDAVNKPQEFMMGKRLITGKVEVDQVRLADPDVPMKELLS